MRELRSKGVGPWPEGQVATLVIKLEGQEMPLMNGGPVELSMERGKVMSPWTLGTAPRSWEGGPIHPGAR